MFKNTLYANMRICMSLEYELSSIGEAEPEVNNEKEEKNLSP
jgi:hypothetical protein